MQDFKIEHDKRRNWYFFRCVRCGAEPHGFFNKKDGNVWADNHMKEVHSG